MKDLKSSSRWSISTRSACQPYKLS